MTEKEQINHFADDLDNLVERYRSEYDISYASIVGSLSMKAFLLAQEASDLSDGL